MKISEPAKSSSFVSSLIPQPSSFHERSEWSFAETAGRLVEISGSRAAASLTLAFGLVLEAQRHNEPVGWVTTGENFFYPPDAARTGIDIDALLVVRVREARAVARAAEKLLRSGGFGMVVLDLGAGRIPMPLLSRLAALAKQHHAALVCLTKKESAEPSLGSLVSLRVEAGRARSAEGLFACDLKVLKDKRRGPTWSHSEVCYGPAGVH
jgi:recombination protein RecA